VVPRVQPGLLDEDAVAHRDQPVGGGRDAGVVGDDHERLPGRAQAIEEPEHVQGCGAVEVAGWLVGEDDARLVAERARNRDPLALAARERRGQMLGPVCEPDLFQQLRGPAACRARRAPGQQRGQLDVLRGGELLHQMEGLEDEANRVAAQPSQRLLAQLVDAAPRQPHLARCTAHRLPKTSTSSSSKNIETETMVPVHSYYGEDFCVMEHAFTGTVPGEFLGVAVNGRRITFRMLHVWEFRDGLMSRENVWLDGGSIVAPAHVARPRYQPRMTVCFIEAPTAGDRRSWPQAIEARVSRPPVSRRRRRSLAARSGDAASSRVRVSPSRWRRRGIRFPS
jgi:hypothetical protein